MLLDVRPKVVPPLDPGFSPGILFNRAFQEIVQSSGKAVPLIVALERSHDSISVLETQVLPQEHKLAEANLRYAERLVKTLLWQRGGHRLVIGGPREIGEFIRQTYSPGGARAFDAELMTGVYESRFVVEVKAPERVPRQREESVPLGRHLDGCRIGFDLGASDRKVSAVVDGEAIFTEEVVWDPRNQTNPAYHYHEIMSGLHRAAARLSRVDAIGGSAAGVYI